MFRNTRYTPEEFWARGVRVGPCLEWPGVKDASGYGRLRYGAERRKWRAHRLAWTLARGPIPDGLQVCHTCDNPACFDPLHLFLGTNDDNHRDAAAKGRQKLVGRAGERNHEAKLNEAQVREIRLLAAAGMAQSAIGPRFGVTPATVSKIVTRVNWPHLE